VTGRTLLRAAVSAALLVCGTAAAPAVPPAAAGALSGTLPGGVAYEVRPDPAQPAAAVALWYRAPASGFGPTAQPGIARLAASTVAGSTPVTGTPLSRLVERYGGRVSVSVYPDSVAITALVPPERAVETVRAMTSGYFAPVVAQDGLTLAQRELAEDAVYRSFDPEQALEDLLGSALFARGPLHDGLIGTPNAYRETSLAQVRAFAERAFRPANAILVLTGNVDAGALSAVASRNGAAPAAEAPAVETAQPTPAPLSRTGNATGIGLGWIGPPIADEAAATALDFTADALFAPGGAVTKAIGSRKAVVSGKFVTYHDPGVFLVTISGDDAEAVRPLVARAVADAAKPMGSAAFAAARAAYTYHILSSIETPGDQAATYGWYSVEGDAAYAPAEGGTGGRYFRLAAALTPDSVARTVARYLGPAPAVVTLTAEPPPSGKKTAT
jgi:zinc protease